MPLTAFTLQIPADVRYAAVAADAAAKFVELVGGAEAEGLALGAAVTDAARAAFGRAPTPLTFAFSLQPAGIEVVVTGGAAEPSIVRQPIAASPR